MIIFKIVALKDDFSLCVHGARECLYLLNYNNTFSQIGKQFYNEAQNILSNKKFLLEGPFPYNWTTTAGVNAVK